LWIFTRFSHNENEMNNHNKMEFFQYFYYIFFRFSENWLRDSIWIFKDSFVQFSNFLILECFLNGFLNYLVWMLYANHKFPGNYFHTVSLFASSLNSEVRDIFKKNIEKSHNKIMFLASQLFPHIPPNKW
jgi:hypothetical protein